MLLGNLYTALCSCLLIVTCYVDADKCRLPQVTAAVFAALQ